MNCFSKKQKIVSAIDCAETSQSVIGNDNWRAEEKEVGKMLRNSANAMAKIKESEQRVSCFPRRSFALLPTLAHGI